MREIIIQPVNKWELINLKEIWTHRELLYIFVWRDVKVRYKQTLLGVLWVVFQPLMSTGIFTVFFGQLANISTGEVPYTLFVFIGLIFWSFFSNSLSRISESMVVEQSLIKKIYFPKLILPISIIFTNLFDLLVNFIVLIIMANVFNFPPSLYFVFIFILSTLIAGSTALGLGLVLASLNVKYRDVRYVLPYFIQLLLFVTPIIYPMAIVGNRNRLIMSINPMSLAIEIIRAALTNKTVINPQVVLISLISLVVIIFSGLWYFRKTEQYFADIV